MELEQLRNEWKDAEGASKSLETLDLRRMLSRQPANPIAKMRRNLKRELFALVLVYGVLIAFLSFSDDLASFYSIVLLIVVAFLFLLYFRHKQRLLDGMECISCEVKANLGTRIKSLEKLVRLYLTAANLSIPLSLLFLGALSWNNAETGLGSFLQTDAGRMIFLGIGVFLTIVGSYVNRWYIFHLYGKYIIQLKTLYHEMDESNPNHI